MDEKIVIEREQLVHNLLPRRCLPPIFDLSKEMHSFPDPAYHLSTDSEEVLAGGKDRLVP